MLKNVVAYGGVTKSKQPEQTFASCCPTRESAAKVVTLLLFIVGGPFCPYITRQISNAHRCYICDPLHEILGCTAPFALSPHLWLAVLLRLPNISKCDVPFASSQHSRIIMCLLCQVLGIVFVWGVSKLPSHSMVASLSSL